MNDEDRILWYLREMIIDVWNGDAASAAIQATLAAEVVNRLDAVPPGLAVTLEEVAKKLGDAPQ